MWTVVVAGGSGLRFGSRKQFADLAGRSVLQRSIDAAASVSVGIVIVVPEDSCTAVAEEATTAGVATVHVVAGGDTRAESVRAGLAAVPETTAFILVHDAARPLASPSLFASVVAALVGPVPKQGAHAVIPVVPVADTIRHRQGGIVDRDQLLAVQTPQGFRATTLREAHRAEAEATDDATLVEALGHPIAFVDGERHNQKLTEPVDLIAARAMILEIEESS